MRGVYVVVTSIEFRDFKGLKEFGLRTRSANVLVGPNNCGKSTVLGAFRVLAAGIRKARAKSPERVTVENGKDTLGYTISPDDLPVSFENAHTNYADVDSVITIRLSNSDRFVLVFPKSGGCTFVVLASTRPPSSPKEFRDRYPIDIVAVPVLGPVEHEELLLQYKTVQASLGTHRASRHFRNYWYHYPEEFATFQSMVRSTWPGMSILRPELVDGPDGYQLNMFCTEDRITRELFWVGSGFQIWCQLLTHITRAKSTSLLVVDEPEIYLHPDLQRQFVRLLRNAGCNFIVATHSAEIIGESDPVDISIVHKRWRCARHLTQVEEVQDAIDSLGSLQNHTLSQLARTRRVLFIEGEDFKLLRRFADRIGLTELATGFGITPVPVEGFSNWRRVNALAWGFAKVLQHRMELAVVFDRDFHCDEEIGQIRAELEKFSQLVHFHARKEIENYLLIPEALQRAVARNAQSRKSHSLPDVTSLLSQITEEMRHDVQAQLLARRCEFIRSVRPSEDAATTSRETLAAFERKWATLDGRLDLCSGKDVLKRLNQHLSAAVCGSLTHSAILAEIRHGEVPPDLVEFLQKLDAFRISGSEDDGRS